MQHKLNSIEQLKKNFLPHDLPIMFLDLSIRTGEMIKTSILWVVDFRLFIQRESPNVVFSYLTSVQIEFYVESMTVDCVGRVGCVGCGCCGSSLHDRRFMSQRFMNQAGRTRYFARSATRARSARRGEEKNKAPVRSPLFLLFRQCSSTR